MSKGLRRVPHCSCFRSGCLNAQTENWTLSFDLTVDEALALRRRAILAAAHHDAFSGGSINCILSFDYEVLT